MRPYAFTPDELFLVLFEIIHSRTLNANAQATGLFSFINSTNTMVNS